MRIAYLDCFSGISGDMFLGALVDAGVPFELLAEDGRRPEHRRDAGAVARRSGGISATKIDVAGARRERPAARGVLARSTSGEDEALARAYARRDAEHLARARRIGRHLERDSADHRCGSISDRAKRTANEIFRALGEAEAKVHNVDVEKIHFHEVGAADAIVDIVCAAVGAEALGVERFVCFPAERWRWNRRSAPTGSCRFPRRRRWSCCKGVPIYSGEIQKELVTPTGAAIVKVLVIKFRPASGDDNGEDRLRCRGARTFRVTPMCCA